MNIFSGTREPRSDFEFVPHETVGFLGRFLSFYGCVAYETITEGLFSDLNEIFEILHKNIQADLYSFTKFS